MNISVLKLRLPYLGTKSTQRQCQGNEKVDIDCQGIFGYSTNGNQVLANAT